MAINERLNSDGNNVNFKLTGRLDSHSTFCKQFPEEAFYAVRAGKRVLVDMTDVSYISFEGLRILSQVAADLLIRDKKLQINNSRQGVYRSLCKFGHNRFMEVR